MAGILKDADELKDYIKNLGIEYRFSCYSEKNPQGCDLLGRYLQTVDRDYEKANKVFKENCDARKFGQSCTSYAQNQLNGRGCTRNGDTAVEYFVKACELDDPSGCDAAGKIYSGFESTLSQYNDHERGLKYLLRGCNTELKTQLFETSESCYAAAFVYAFSKLIPKDLEKTIELGTKACELGQMRACKLVSETYSKLGNEEMSKKFLDQFNKLKKQIDSNLEIKMERT